jgi:hypothetical protein
MKKKDRSWQTADSTMDDPKRVTLGRQGRQGPPREAGEEPMDSRDLEIAKWVRKMPDLEPPPDLLTSVMRAVQPKKLSWAKRVDLWARSPKSVTFVPWRVAPVALAVLGILILSSSLINKQQDSRFYSDQHRSGIPVVFRLGAPEARSVAVVGTFNGWKPKGYELHFDPEKRTWSLTVRLPEGRYEYAFLVDGEKILPDPDALLYQEDGFGNENSVMILGKRNGENV